MSGDFSRRTFIPQNHYSGVLMQQGRVQLDADWNEQLEIHRHRTETEAIDVIGPCGVPQATNGFKVGEARDGADLTISPGRIYVDGLLCELEATPVPITAFVESDQAVVQSLMVDARPFQVGQWVEIWDDIRPKVLFRITDVDAEQGLLTLDEELAGYQLLNSPKVRRVTTYLTQPDYPNPEFTSSPASPPMSPPSPSKTLDLDDGTYVVFLDVWQRNISALDDPHIREVALGGPDTTTRVKNVWQVRLLPVSTEAMSPPTSPPIVEITCQTSLDGWNRLTAPSTGMLTARTSIAEDPQNLCLLPPSAGYRRLENQLYRAEVHTGGDRDGATFKWSRDNAAVETTIEEINGYIVTVADIGKDEVLGFAAGQWVEIVDAESELKGIPHPLMQITKVNPDTREITLEQSAEGLEGRQHLKLRRWDQTGDMEGDGCVGMTSDWMDLEDGIQVFFSEGQYHSGDYWLIPARTATGEIEWPPFEVPNTKPIPQPPLGIHHHYCRLALLTVQDGTFSLTDCRTTFPPLREPGIGIQEILCIADGRSLLNDSLVSVSRLRGGLRVVCDAPLSQESGGGVLPTPPFSLGTVPAKPTCFVTLDLPYPLGPDRNFWDSRVPGVIGFQPLILGSTVAIQDTQIEWIPTSTANTWLQEILFQRLEGAQITDRVLAHLTVKGNFIWRGDSDAEPAVYLDGEAFGRPGPPDRPGGVGRVDLRFPTGDGRRGGDFEMWFWLTPPSGRFWTVIFLAQAPEDTEDTVVGAVQDSARRPVPGADVSLSRPGETRNILTDEQGRFRFSGLQLGGDYQLTVQFGDLTETQMVTVGTTGRVLDPADYPGRTLRQVYGIGERRSTRLAQNGITHPAQVASMAPTELAEILRIREDQARTLIDNARRLLLE